MHTSPSGLRAPDVFVVPLASRRLTGAIRELVESLWLAGKIPFVDPVYEAVIERESRHGTQLADGIAAPYARLEALSGIAYGIGISPYGIDPDNGSTDRIRLVMLSVSGLASVAEHVSLLAGIDRTASCADVFDCLKGAHTPEEAATCFPSATGRYRTRFTSLFAPLTPQPVYELV